MNLDRATELFLQAFPTRAREEGERLFNDGAVTQIGGDHIVITGKVRTGLENFNVTLQLKGNRWEAICNDEEDSLHAAVYATVLEKIERGDNLPEGMGEEKVSDEDGDHEEADDDDATVDGKLTIFSAMEKVLGRGLDVEEEQFASKIDRRWVRFEATGEMFDTDIIRLHPQWEVKDYEPRLDLWPTQPENVVDFWNYIAYALEKERLGIPDVMRPMTNTAAVADKMAAWEKDKERAEWGLTVSDFAHRPPQKEALTAELRLMLTTDDVRLQIEGAEEFRSIASAADLSELQAAHQRGALLFDEISEIIWAFYLHHWGNHATLEIDLSKPESAARLNLLFWQEPLQDRLVDLDARPIGTPLPALSWNCAQTENAESDDDSYWKLQLSTADGTPFPHTLRYLPGKRPLYLSDDQVYGGPEFWSEVNEVAPSYAIPTDVLETSAGVHFLGSLDIDLPEEMASRIEDRPMKVNIKSWLAEAGSGGAESEQIWLRVTAEDSTKERQERLGSIGWEITADPTPVEGVLPRYDRSSLLPIPGLLDDLKATYLPAENAFKVRVTKALPEKFADWANELPDDIVMDTDEQVQSLLDEPVQANVKFEVEEAETGIDWFDIKLTIDVEGHDLSQVEIRNLVNARGGFVRLKNKGWMRLELNLGEGEAETIDRLGLDAYDMSGKTHRMHALQLAEPAGKEIFDEAAWNKIHERSEALKLGIKPSPPEGIKATLRPYQLEGFQFLGYLASNNFGGLLADDMGLGKTVQTLTWLYWLRKEYEDGTPPPVLVVCPKSVLDVWAGEAEKFAPDLRVQVLYDKSELDIDNLEKKVDMLVLNYAQLRGNIEDLKKIHWLAAVLDEGQQIKNPDSKAAKSARALVAHHRLVLSGTPIENRLLDVWSLMAFAMPGILGDRATFRERFDRRRDPVAHKRLASRLRPFVLRRTKDQVALDLPEKTEEEVYCTMEPAQQEAYDEELARIRQMVLGMAEDGSLKKGGFAVLQGLTRLRQICCSPSLLGSDAESAKLNALFYHLDQLKEGGHKVLVFSQFTTVLEIIRERLEDEDRPYHLLTGKTENRSEVVRDFQRTEDPSVFLLSLKAGGTGLNLTAASYVILFDPWWNPAVEAQAIDRTHRIGQTNNVIAYRLITRNTVEEKIRHLQKQKQDLFQGVIGEEAFSKNLDLTDLKFLLGAEI